MARITPYKIRARRNCKPGIWLHFEPSVSRERMERSLKLAKEYVYGPDSDIPEVSETPLTLGGAVQFGWTGRGTRWAGNTQGIRNDSDRLLEDAARRMARLADATRADTRGVKLGNKAVVRQRKRAIKRRASRAGIKSALSRVAACYIPEWQKKNNSQIGG